MIGERIYRNFGFLKELAMTKSHTKRLKLLRNANTEQLLSVIEAAANVGDFQTFCPTKHEINKLKPHRRYIQKVSRTTNPNEARLVLQKGGGPFFAALLVPFLAEVVRSIIN